MIVNNYLRALEERKKQHLLRHLPLPPEGIDFYSNDYLGLAQSKDFQRLIEATHPSDGMKNGATGSRLLSGNSSYTEAVESKIAQFHQAEAALIYGSGYTANLGLVSSLATRDTTLLMDELCHASLIDGARLGQAERVRFKHNDPASLEEKLKKTTRQSITIVESIYSMDGDICPLHEIAELCQAYGSLLIVDEAHAIGVLGSKGEGLVGQLGLEEHVTARIMTYGKAPGIHGAAVMGPQWLKDYQVNFSRPLIFSTAPSPHQVSAISSFYDFIGDQQALRAQLQKVVGYFLQKRKLHNGRWLASESHIQSLIIPGNDQVISAGNRLKKAGINALPIRKPSVAEGAERIRFCLHAYNTPQEIDQLFDVL